MTTTTGLWTLPLPYTSPPLHQNQRQHWAAAARTRTRLASEVGWLAKAHHVPTGLTRVHITLHWQPAIRRTRDTDNPAPTVKACIDALTRIHRLVPDDDSTHVTSDVVIHPVARPARLWLTIEETE